VVDWAREFYTKQMTWTGLAAQLAERSLHDPNPWADRRVAAVERHARAERPLRILELGAGSGSTAAALADRGNTVVAVDIVEECVANARRLADEVRQGELRVIQGDFYEIELDGTFDVVCYFDGFGIGSDADQRRLLRRIDSWLEPDGCALIDVLTPWFWTKMAGQEEEWDPGSVKDRYDFDPDGCRMLDRMWRVGDESNAVTQTIRCYSPADFRLLLEGTGLVLQGQESFGNETYEQVVPLQEAMIYLAKLAPMAGTLP
jgi:SAM-dependent methyltransferase